MDSIYLDNNSTTPLHPEVAQTISDCLAKGYLNPASQHASGRMARRVIEAAREQISQLLGICMKAPQQDSLILTSGGTESNNLAIRGLVAASGEVLISSIEHPSALAAAEQLEAIGCQITKIPVDQNGFASASFVTEHLSDETRLVCLMLGNNETGTLQPVREIAEVCSKAGVPLHCDAVQVVGKLPLDFGELGVSTLAISAHKFHGPRGIGGLAVKNGLNLQPLLVGGSQQLGLRPGTESVSLAAGMAKALEISQRDLQSRASQLQKLRDHLQHVLVTGCSCWVNGVEPRLPHTLNVSFNGIDRQALLMALDLAGVECSTGSACTSGSSEPSHVLEAMGLPQDRIAGAIRFSLGAFSTESQIAEAGARILDVVKRLAPEK